MKELDLHQISRICVRPLQGRKESDRLTICLIMALSIADFIDPELTVEANREASPQLGVLALAASLREAGFTPQVVNLNELLLRFLRLSERQPIKAEDQHLNHPIAAVDGDPSATESQETQHFFEFVVEHLKLISCDVFGFSSICSSYPLTVRLAQEVKRLNPDAKIILGGPQASVVDVATMRAFTGIDFIVRGEGDETFPRLLQLLSHGSGVEFDSVPGITFRRGGDVIRNSNGPVVNDLDRLPLPAFDLDPDIRNRKSIDLEIGRGCPFACTFCSTNDFFRRNFRLKSSHKMIEEMGSIKKHYGIEHFSLAHDMYTIDRKKVMAFCEALLASEDKFTWGCSARTDCIDDELIAVMADAGCRGIFFGIETGSQRLQHTINKKLDLAEARERISCADRHGIRTAVAFIVGFPDETLDDLRDTLHFFVDSLRLEHAEPQISLLAPLAATPIYEQYKERLVFDHIFSDMSHQGWRQDPVEVEMIKTHPNIFPNFYAIPTTWLDRSYLNEIMNFVTYLATWFRWMPVALLQDSGDLVKVFDSWQIWLTERKGSDLADDASSTPYYSRRKFRKDFLEFVRTCYLVEMATATAAITGLTQTEGAFIDDEWEGLPTRQSVQADEHLDGECVPYRTASLVVDLGIDYKELIERLRNELDLQRVCERKATIVLTPADGKQIGVWQLAPLSATLLRYCDGKRTVAEITREFAEMEKNVGEIPAEKVCLFGLMKLRQDGFIGFSSFPVGLEKTNDDREIASALPCRVTPQATMAQQQS